MCVLVLVVVVVVVVVEIKLLFQDFDQPLYTNGHSFLCPESDIPCPPLLCKACDWSGQQVFFLFFFSLSFHIVIFLLHLSLLPLSLFLSLLLSLPLYLPDSLSSPPPLQPIGCDDPDCCGPAQNGEMERAEKWCDASVPPYETLTIGETSK